VCEQTQQEGIDQGHQQEQLTAGFPLRHAWGLQVQLTFPVAKTGLDLPPARIRYHHLPSRFLTVDGLIGRTVTTVRLLVGLPPTIRDRHRPHAAPAAPAHWSGAVYATAHPRSCAALPRRVCGSRDLPGFAFAAFAIEQLVAAAASAAQNAPPLGPGPPTMAHLPSRDQTGAAPVVPTAVRTPARGGLPAHVRWSLARPCDSTSACSPPAPPRSSHRAVQRSIKSRAPRLDAPVY
jgi:hypothetical protein